MGLGGSILLILIGIVIGYILVTEIPWRKKRTSPPQGYEGMPKVSVVLVPAPEGMVQALTPPWQAEVTDKLKEEGFSLMGDYSYPALNFFWARTFISPDKKSVLLLVNWVEGKEGGKVIIPNLEIYSFTGNSFLLTACSQDGAARLLTGANRPRKVPYPSTSRLFSPKARYAPLCKSTRNAWWNGSPGVLRRANSTEPTFYRASRRRFPERGPGGPFFQQPTGGEFSICGIF